MNEAIVMRDVSKAYGGLHVFNNVSLSVAKGARLGILGPNGAGKSTMFNLMSGLQRPTKGEIHFDGRPLNVMKPWDVCRAGIGRTFQIPQPFGGMSVVDNIMVGCTNGLGLSVKQARLRADEILETVNLADQKHRLANELTLLDLKRLELARAAALEPKLLLLDEIAGGLTDAECDDLLTILDRLVTPQTTVIWIEHVVHALTRFVSEIAVLADKRIVARGTIDDVLANADVRALYFGVEEHA